MKHYTTIHERYSDAVSHIEMLENEAEEQAERMQELKEELTELTRQVLALTAEVKRGR